MLRKPCLLVPMTMAGLAAGGIYGRSQGSDLWPEHSRVFTLWCMAVGWLVGLALAGILSVVFRSRTETAGHPTVFVRAARIVALTLALSPGALWVNALLPGGPLRQEIQTGSQFGRRGPSIVLISIDALRADHLGAYGSEAGLTPNLDAFAREATVYRSAVAASPWTLGSLGALFTGLPPSRSIYLRDEGEEVEAYAERASLLSGVSLLPEELSRVGYVTAAELTNPFLSENRGWRRGFRYFRNEDGGDAGALLTTDTARAEVVTAHARAWLDLKHGAPFFLWMHYLDPHAPYDSPDAPESLRNGYPAEWETKRTYWYDTMVNAQPEEQARYEEYCRRTYAEEVRYADRWVGELLAELKRRGIYDEAAIAIISDHGEELFEHGQFEHGHTMHNELLHVPLLVKWPKGTRADPVVTQVVTLESLGATLLELAGAPAEAGTSIAPLPRYDADDDTAAYSEAPLYGADQTALTTSAYKVIYHLPSAETEGSFEVYDRRVDPSEGRDLAGNGVAEKECERLRRLTEAAVTARGKAIPGEPARRGLDETTRRGLKSLGYLSN